MNEYGRQQSINFWRPNHEAGEANIVGVIALYLVLVAVVVVIVLTAVGR